MSYDYDRAQAGTLHRWWREFTHAKSRMTCERGHLNCGAGGGARRGFPPCSLTVYATMLRVAREIG